MINIIIPARLKSKRFPKKPLVKILNVPMVIRVARVCEKVISKKNIFIATDSKSISDLVSNYGFNFILTSSKCMTGTDRVAEASKKIKGKIFINVQGDEPLVKPSDIRKIIKYKLKYKNNVICGYNQIPNRENAKSNSLPKVVFNKNKELIYISRSLIPGSKKNVNKYYKQVCIYGFNKNELSKFHSFKKKSKIELIEDIELLRFFETKIRILMVKLSNSSIAVDYPSDVRKVEKLIKK
jgi:3-deoxy-manno-octulosonate cytidylyltransferase (CMP-KDO synthetase)